MNDNDFDNDFAIFIRELYDLTCEATVSRDLPKGFHTYAALASSCLGLVLCELNDSESVDFEKEREVFYRMLRGIAQENEAEWTHFMSKDTKQPKVSP